MGRTLQNKRRGEKDGRRFTWGPDDGTNGGRQIRSAEKQSAIRRVGIVEEYVVWRQEDGQHRRLHSNFPVLRRRRDEQKGTPSVAKRVQRCEGEAPWKELWSHVLRTTSDCRDLEKGVWNEHGLRPWKPFYLAQGKLLSPAAVEQHARPLFMNKRWRRHLPLTAF